MRNPRNLGEAAKCISRLASQSLMALFVVSLAACSTTNGVPAHVLTAETVAWEQSYQQRMDSDQSATEDPLSAALAFKLAFVTADPTWAQESMAQFAQLQKQSRFSELALAGLGATSALKARDFPIHGVIQAVVPGPGLIRLNHVASAIRYLDLAVERAPGDPRVRFYRALTYLNLPKLFRVREQGLHDYSMLNSWIVDASWDSRFDTAQEAEFYRQDFGALFDGQN